jgi:hypothetical protein
MNNTEPNIRFTEIQTKISDPSEDPFYMEIACTYKTPSGFWFTRITDTPRACFKLMQWNQQTNKPKGPTSHYRKSKKGTWRLKLKVGDGRCPRKGMSPREWKGFLEGVRRALAQIREVKEALEQDQHQHPFNFSRN